MAKLSDTALVLLNKAAIRDDRLVEPPNHLPAAARNAVVRSLLKQGLLIEDAVELNHPVAWRNDETDADLRCSIALRMTDDGFRALNMDPPESESAADDAHTDALTAPDAASVQEGAPVVAKALEAAQDAPVPATRASLRDAAAAVLKAWDDRDNQPHHLPEAIQHLRAALAAKAGRPAREPGTPRKPREGTKQQTVLGLLRRDEGANIAQIVAATAWAQHTVRGFLANLKRKGITVEVLERVRQVGPGITGAKGSYSIYRIVSAG
jgi:hypothetical protein